LAERLERIGTVHVRGNTKVDVQVEGGTLATAAIQAGSTTTMSVRNPWPGKQAEVVNGSTGAVVVAATTATTLTVPVGRRFFLPGRATGRAHHVADLRAGHRQPGHRTKTLGGKVQIGLP